VYVRVPAATNNLRYPLAALAWLLLAVAPQRAQAQETVCARVKIEIKQELTLERQAFDAEMKISNTLDASSLTDVGVVVKVTDEAGVPVPISDDPNNTSAKFFIRVANRQNIGSVDGSGAVAAWEDSALHQRAHMRGAAAGQPLQAVAAFEGRDDTAASGFIGHGHQLARDPVEIVVGQ
jgi:hypothetical protein